MKWFSDNKELIAIGVSILVGILVRFLYDFCVKPLFLKKKVEARVKLKKLIKHVQNYQEDLPILLNYLKNHEIYQSYYHQLKIYAHKDLSTKEQEIVYNILKKLKKL